MKILLLADPSNPHTIRWANSLSEKGIDIFLFGLAKYDKNVFNDNIKVESLKTPAGIKAKLSGNILKGIYFSAIPKLKKVIRAFKPDVLHAHYAGSNGFIGAIANYHPFILSVWGIDINIFPNTSFLHKRIINYTLQKADKILATSNSLKLETNKYTDKNITVTPFGIDTSIFKPSEEVKKDDEIIIGTVKRLESKYGIDQLLKVFAVLKKKYPGLNLKLLLVGEGSKRRELEELTDKLKIKDETIFAGIVPFDRISEYHNKIDIEVYLSHTESFGVSVLEAQACGNPAVVNNVGGLPEVIIDGETGFTVSPGNIDETVHAVSKLIEDKKLREQMGKRGRENVINRYNWNDNVEQMISIYKKIIKENESAKSRSN